MKKLMGMAIEDMKKSGCDYSGLGGQRQRYEYFGYSQANNQWFFTVSATNVRHALSGREPLLTYRDGELFGKNGEKSGTINGYSLTLSDYSLTPDAVAAYLNSVGQSSSVYRVAPYELEKIEAFGSLSENISFANYGMQRIFNFRRCLEAGLKLRAAAGLCENGEITLRVGEETFGIRINGSEVETFDCDTPEYEFEPHELQELALSQYKAIVTHEKRIPHGWFPVMIG